MSHISIRRTGNVYSIASSEFVVTYPDGHVGTIWSPPWHELSPDAEQAAALEYASKLFRKSEHKEAQHGSAKRVGVSRAAVKSTDGVDETGPRRA